MPTLTYISATKKTHIIEAKTGLTLMEIALDNDVEGIDADCGGGCACATCHIIIPAEFIKTTGPADEDEDALLDFIDGRKIGSRLSCQIEMSEELDGMTVIVPQI